MPLTGKASRFTETRRTCCGRPIRMSAVTQVTTAELVVCATSLRAIASVFITSAELHSWRPVARNDERPICSKCCERIESRGIMLPTDLFMRREINGL